MHVKCWTVMEQVKGAFEMHFNPLFAATVATWKTPLSKNTKVFLRVDMNWKYFNFKL